jgi:hypothetical protein
MGNYLKYVFLDRKITFIGQNQVDCFTDQTPGTLVNTKIAVHHPKYGV